VRIGHIEFIPYRGRELQLGEDVWVYRNLMRSDGAWYSVLQRGRVVGHTRQISIAEPTMLVREAGRRRAIREGRKNVHAFVVGRVAPRVDPSADLSVRVRYDMRGAGFFVDPSGCVVTRAAVAVLNERGLSVQPAERAPEGAR
jgi:hypothetical protein